MKVDISFVIPCYCSENNLNSVVDDIHAAMLHDKTFTYEIILVNDNSSDGTKSLIDRLCESDNRIRGIHFTKNFGQPAALLAGFRVAQGEVVMTSDDDGQTPVEFVWDFYKKLQEGYDVVCAQYTSRPQKSIVRKLGTKTNEYMLQHLLGKPEDIGMSSFVMISRSIVDEIIKYEGPFPYMAGLLLRSTSKIANVDIEQRDRLSGKSGYSISKLIKSWLNGFTTFSVKPLRLASLFGGISAFAGIILVIIMIIRRIISEVPVAMHIQTGILLLMAGLILVALGLIGEYVGRIYMTINNAPQYVIQYMKNIENDE